MNSTLDSLLENFLLVEEALGRALKGSMAYRTIEIQRNKIGAEIDKRIDEMVAQADISEYE